MTVIPDPADEPGEALRYRFADAEFDEAEGQLRVAGKLVPIEPRPLKLLQLLLRFAGEVVTKDELLDRVWEGRQPVDHVVANAVSKLRSALGSQAAERVQTVPRIGYRLVGPVQRQAARPSQTVLRAGQPVPAREGFVLEQALGQAEHGEVWRARHAKLGQVHVFKFASDGPRMAALKREFTLYRVLLHELGPRDDFVRVLDGHFTSAPFFLECEDGGQNLLDWAATGALQALGREQRLALFLQLARAVAAAHSVGVLHRDLKPANVLVAETADGPRLRLTDFGSGRLLEPAKLQSLQLTALGQTLAAGTADADSFTYLYVAPEVLAGHAPSVQSDVYALGLMLFQVVVGDLRCLLAGGWEDRIDDALLIDDIAAATHGDTARRLSSAGELVSRLERLPARRAEAEAARAARARAAVRDRQLARARARRPWVLATTLALGLGMGLSLWQLSQARQAARAEQMARLEADAVNQFLTRDLLASPDLARTTVAEAPSMLDLLLQASAGLGSRFEDQPLLEAAIRLQLGRAHFRLWSTTHAFQEYERAIALREPRVAADDEMLAIMRLEYSQLSCRSHWRQGCLEAYDRALRDIRLERLGQPNELGLAEADARVGVMHLRGRPADAEAAARQLLALTQLAHPADPDRLSQAHLRLGHALLRQDDYAGAEGVITALSAPPLVGTAAGLAGVASMRMFQAARHRDTGQYAAGEPILLAVVASLEPPAPASAWHLGYVRSELGHLYAAWQRYDKAADWFGRAVEHFKPGMGRRHQFTVITQMNQLTALNNAGRFAQAVALGRDEDLLSKVGRLRNRIVVTVENGRALIATGRAEEAYRSFAAFAMPEPGADLGDALEPSWRLHALRGLALVRMGQRERGISVAREALAGLREVGAYPTRSPELDLFLEGLR